MTTPTPTPTPAPTWRRWAPPLTLVVLLALAAATIARAAIPPADDVAAEIHAPAGRALIPELAAPVPTASPEPFVSPLEIVLPPPPAAESPRTGSSGGSSGGGSTGAGTSVGTDYVAFCNAGGGASATASTVNGLLAAANAERARFGFRALSWSGPLAGAAQSWSESMASKYNPASPGGALTHGNTPSSGGQNVAAAWTTGGSMSQSSAIGRAHSGWMASSGHCKNILNPNWSVMGAGSAPSFDGKAWYTTANYQ
ncbi:CAP domain-containing protein [Demequina sp.]|uniref:CAP domain-containing protein n=1 Tax=Demequina sp. TaxID=2050685 RepID=UPI0025BC4A2D|nr:CAP domain-containing protein [Demequina sp.]